MLSDLECITNILVLNYRVCAIIFNPFMNLHTDLTLFPWQNKLICFASFFSNVNCLHIFFSAYIADTYLLRFSVLSHDQNTIHTRHYIDMKLRGISWDLRYKVEYSVILFVPMEYFNARDFKSRIHCNSTDELTQTRIGVGCSARQLLYLFQRHAKIV